VITTANAGSVLSGTSAFGEIVPIRNVDAIAAALGRRRDRPDARRGGGSPPLVGLEAYRDRLLQAASGAL
jgi:hypothetical protein